MATVIRAGEPATKIAKRLEALDLSDHLALAHSVAAKARQEACATLEHAKREAAHLTAASQDRGYKIGHEKGYKVGHEKGYSEGLAAGNESARAEALAKFAAEQDAVVADFRRVIAELDGMKEDVRISAARDAVNFVVKLASKLTLAIGVSHPEAVITNLERAMRLVGEKSRAVVVIHSADLDAVTRFAAPVAEDLERSTALRIQIDDTIAPGGCRVEADGVEVDATLETQLNEIVTQILGERSTNG
ncbi:MAG: hypothetical protein HY287_13325 [Planctomycetes bacterium]|nr:hypothetical protein [Planctomycetota bacterium]MBI3835304.1 hypothetical protein [Planctomycetota bacterium]